MKRQKENYRSRKSRKKALHLRQYGSDNDAPGSVQANRMIGNISSLSEAIAFLTGRNAAARGK